MYCIVVCTIPRAVTGSICSFFNTGNFLFIKIYTINTIIPAIVNLIPAKRNFVLTLSVILNNLYPILIAGIALPHKQLHNTAINITTNELVQNKLLSFVLSFINQILSILCRVQVIAKL